jgi:hypothetical protein
MTERDGYYGCDVVDAMTGSIERRQCLPLIGEIGVKSRKGKENKPLCSATGAHNLSGIEGVALP